MSTKSRIMYIEFKGLDLSGPARIGRVTFSKSGKSIYYGGRKFFRADGFKANYRDSETFQDYWISGCKKDGNDALYSTRVEIDEDVREEYWQQIRNLPERKAVTSFHCPGKYSK